MDIQQLRVFRAAAKSGGFTRASEQLHLSQSAVSLHIKQLERGLGTELFLRVGKRVYLNQSGRTLLEYVERIFHEMRNAEMAVSQVNNLERGIVRLGVGATTLTYLMPRILSGYIRKYPKVELIVTTGLSENLAHGVHAQSIDLAIVMEPLPTNLSIEILPILQEELVCVLNSQNPLATKEALLPKDLDGIRLIGFLRDSAMRTLVDRYFADMKSQPNLTMELENIEAIKALVRSGLGIAVLPESSVRGSQGTKLKALRVKGFPMSRQLGLALPKTPTIPLATLKLAARIARDIAGKTLTDLRAGPTVYPSSAPARRREF
jgi:DNA-binding transcriptional LysR family regulator